MERLIESIRLKVGGANLGVPILTQPVGRVPLQQTG